MNVYCDRSRGATGFIVTPSGLSMSRRGEPSLHPNNFPDIIGPASHRSGSSPDCKHFVNHVDKEEAEQDEDDLTEGREDDGENRDSRQYRFHPIKTVSESEYLRALAYRQSSQASTVIIRIGDGINVLHILHLGSRALWQQFGVFQ